MKMANDQHFHNYEQLSMNIVNRGMQDGSLSFSVRVRRGLSDFVSSVNLKYVWLGYRYLINHGALLVVSPLVAVVSSMILGKLQITWELWDASSSSSSSSSKSIDQMLAISTTYNSFFLVGLLICLVLYAYAYLMPQQPTYLVDYACYCPPNELKVSKERYIELARKSGNFEPSTIEFQQQVLKNSGLGDDTYLPHRTIFRPGFRKSLKDGREEAAAVILGAVDDLLAATSWVRARDIKILIVNCSLFNTTPSLSAMVINHYKLKHNTVSYNLGGMGCAAGMIAISLASDLLQGAYPGSYALVVSTENVSFAWYTGKDIDMIVPNCFLRMGAAAMLLSSRRIDRWRAKYELKQLVRTHKSTDARSFNSLYLKQDAEGIQSLSVSKEVIEVGGHALKDNITALGSLVLPLKEHIQFFTTLLFGNKSKPYNTPEYKLKLAFKHICILATSKKVLDEIQKNLDLTDDYMEASRKTLERFGNTSSSSVWYELAYLEAKGKVKRGDRVWQIALGSGLKCNSAVWLALRNVSMTKKNPWFLA
ncbi:hypothetical protein Dimus_026779 [Dionaea muscipula]